MIMCPVRCRHTLPTCRVNVAWGVPLYDGAQAQAPAAQVCQLFLSLGHLLVVLHLPPTYDQEKVSATANCRSDLPSAAA